MSQIRLSLSNTQRIRDEKLLQNNPQYPLHVGVSGGDLQTMDVEAHIGNRNLAFQSALSLYFRSTLLSDG